MSRILEQIVGGRPGPTLIVIGGIHGNEPAGVVAARAVLGRVDRDSINSAPPFGGAAPPGRAGLAIAGEVCALAGNVGGLAANRRFFKHDLNRLWLPEHLAAARADADRRDERAELVELADELDRVIARARGPVFALDLHTTSAAGVPFAVVGATAAHRAFAGELPLPGIVGLEEQLPGVLTRYLSGLGCVTVAIEGGQSDSADTLANLEAVIVVALVACGVIGADAMPELATARAWLARVRGDLPPMIDVVSRRAITPADQFRMEPGFANIQRTTRGTLLARDAHGEIHAPFDGFVLLPLYQAQGSDGFFYGT